PMTSPSLRFFCPGTCLAHSTQPCMKVIGLTSQCEPSCTSSEPWPQTQVPLFSSRSSGVPPAPVACSGEEATPAISWLTYSSGISRLVVFVFVFVTSFMSVFLFVSKQAQLLAAEPWRRLTPQVKRGIVQSRADGRRPV